MGQRGTRGAVASRLTDGFLLALDGLVAVILAPQCAACLRPLEHPSLGAVCGRCWASIQPLTPPLCDVCGDPLAILGEPRNASLDIVEGAKEFASCRRCRETPPCISRARAIGVYEGALRAIVHALKYDARRSLAAPLGERMRARGGAVLRDAACVVPVPLHPSRRRERGFNQARDLAGHLGLPIVEALARVRRTVPQAQLSAAGRRQNVHDAFETTRRVRLLIGAAVVLVDDVSTTGATLEACALTLKRAGVAEVRALTAARVVGPRSAEHRLHSREDVGGDEILRPLAVEDRPAPR